MLFSKPQPKGMGLKESHIVDNIQFNFAYIL